MTIGIIGGTGLAALGERPIAVADSAETPFGLASDLPRRFAELPNAVFLNRHGDRHTVLPHLINYRANVWMMKNSGVDAIVAVFAVGGIARSLADGDFVLPDQLVDYSWGREHTFAGPENFRHVDFSEPFDVGLRQTLAESASRIGVDLCDGVYGCTQGPRFETPAEIDRMERDGCTVVGMTAMPEAALARELDLPYAGICLVVNPAAGRGLASLELADMQNVVADAQPTLRRLLLEFLQLVEQPG
ncbi:MAG: S-methyl-5'-thioinosine phosphorylase [Gammaproteobacteria bacterium]|nr:S-methyl-5'-thioinosine phosphorylase [Gammaproteobacteria bacterium]MDE0443679.1 S-methyl-5'-thioinosine phosphorylase [Gammaproteobacteria bacterium]